MLDALEDALIGGPPTVALLIRLGLAFVMGSLVGGIYLLTQRRDGNSSAFITTLVLLTILIAIVTQVIGDNLARAFGLVGALSIVRFRTVVEDTRDTAFVIFAVTVGMAVGAGYGPTAGAALLVVGFAAAVFPPTRSAAPPEVRAWTLNVRVAIAHDPDTLLGPVLSRLASGHEFTGAGTGRQGAALDVTYRLQLAPDTQPTTLIRELNRLDGVQEVELRK